MLLRVYGDPKPIKRKFLSSWSVDIGYIGIGLSRWFHRLAVYRITSACLKWEGSIKMCCCCNWLRWSVRQERTTSISWLIEVVNTGWGQRSVKISKDIQKTVIGYQPSCQATKRYSIYLILENTSSLTMMNNNYRRKCLLSESPSPASLNVFTPVNVRIL
jgi:hypothetical protein